MIEIYLATVVVVGTWTLIHMHFNRSAHPSVDGIRMLFIVFLPVLNQIVLVGLVLELTLSLVARGLAKLNGLLTKDLF